MLLGHNGGHYNTDYISEIKTGKMLGNYLDIKHFVGDLEDKPNSQLGLFRVAKVVVMTNGSQILILDHNQYWDELEQYTDMERMKAWKTLKDHQQNKK